ncbi:c-type cytochrome [Paracoccus marinaquae]|uniref:Cytochrome c domain-containing protein n=1 Tax=Paracoccus marinaquae TaxID=2841926 RepID=A0ABS6AGH0_9RHOB|nr:hypothetical protein [Paracoccus marinaquae]MBU3028734.1 hypothetical protein [Paracoccus marinaquae]
MKRRQLSLFWLVAALSALAVTPAAAGSARADYILHCSGCHGMAGLGTIEGGIPPFPDSVGHIATTETGRTYLLHVPGVISTDMSDADLAEVLNFILDAWGGGEGAPFTADEVTRRRAMPIGDVVIYRRQVVDELRAAGTEIAEYPWP